MKHAGNPTRNIHISAILWAACIILFSIPTNNARSAIINVNAQRQAIIIDHNCVDLAAIPQQYVQPAASLRMLLRHASVGQGIIWGLDCLAGSKPTQSSCSGYLPGKYNRANWVFEARTGDGKSKIDDLVTQAATRTNEFDVFMMNYCYIDALGDAHPDWEYFRSKMEYLETTYPDKIFVWWTIPLTRLGQPSSDWFNAKVRSYCAANKKILFDIADIECYDLAGARLTNAQGDEIISAEYTNETAAGHLNTTGRIRVASAFWRLMARLAQEPRTIQQAVNQASPGDTVVVAPGTYQENVIMKAGVNLQGSGPDITIIDGRKPRPVVTAAGNCRLDAFTITGYADDDIDGLYCEDVNNFVVSNNIIKNNTWSGIRTVRSSIIVRNNLIFDNRVAGIFLDGACAGQNLILNNTVCNNRNEADLTLWHGARALIVNNIIGDIECSETTGLGVTILYNDIFVQQVGLETNIYADPLFADPNNHDYHLKSQAGRWDANEGRWTTDDVTSPCIDAGDPMSPIGLEPFPNGGRINMGAYGGTAEASKSYFGEPVCETIVAGDLNGDCKVDFVDIEIMARHWLQGDMP